MSRSSNRNGLDLNIQRAQKGVMSHPMVPQPSTRPRFEFNSIDFSQSFSQILASLGNFNENAIVSACTDTWRETINSRCNGQDERLLKFEHSLPAMNTAIQGSHSLFLGLLAECRRIDATATQH